MSEFLPSVRELVPAPEADSVFRRWHSLPHCIFLDSAVSDAKLGRYSFLAADPFAFFAAADDLGAWDAARAALERSSAAHAADLPPFQGGAAGFFGYELGRRFEAVPPPRADEFAVPLMAIGLYDLVLAWDHAARRAWIVSQGFPETRPGPRRDRAERRLEEASRWVLGETPPPARRLRQPAMNRVKPHRLVPQFPVGAGGTLTSDFSETAYLRAVERALGYIGAGDVFQVNLAQRLLHPATDSPAALYLRLRSANPAPFSGYFDVGEFQILSTSPERFLKVSGREVQTRPIKGTRRRAEGGADADRLIREELLHSEKDRAENVMIVDLLRNDLGRVCEVGSVRVGEVCRLESYATVHHLVSSVRGRLRPGLDTWDLIAASFPGGSITGAPKIRAMEIIAELEPTARGAYCGSLGYLGFDGTADWNILIRTVTAGRGWWQAPVGGGIVADSDPRDEYRETWHKAEGLIRAIEKD